MNLWIECEVILQTNVYVICKQVILLNSCQFFFDPSLLIDILLKQITYMSLPPIFRILLTIKSAIQRGRGICNNVLQFNVITELQKFDIIFVFNRSQRNVVLASHIFHFLRLLLVMLEAHTLSTQLGIFCNPKIVTSNFLSN